MAAALVAATVTFGVQIAKINATQYQPPEASAKSTPTPAGSKFGSGGLLIGSAHSGGGIKTTLGELEGGEFLVNRIATQAFLPILEQINSIGQSPSARMKTQEPVVIKTYVVANEMTSEQEKQRKIKQLAQL